MADGRSGQAGASRARRPEVFTPVFVWVGRLSFIVERVRRGRSETVEIMLRRDTFEVIVEGRSVGVGDRDALRLWMARPREPLTLDDACLRLGLGGLALVLSVGEYDYPIPTTVEAQLRRDA